MLKFRSSIRQQDKKREKNIDHLYQYQGKARSNHYAFYRAMFNQLYSCNTVYGVKLVKFIFILDSFAFVSQSFVIRTKTPVKEYFCTIWEVK